MKAYNKMTKEEKIKYFLEKFKRDFDYDMENNLDEDYWPDEDYLVIKYLPVHESESFMDKYSLLCRDYANRFRN